MSSLSTRLEGICGAGNVGTWRPPAAVATLGVPETTLVAAPESIEAAAEVLRLAHTEKLRVLPLGAGEHLYRGAPVVDVRLFLSARRLTRVVEYEPEDLTLVAQAGVTLHAIDACTATQAQCLNPDPWPGIAATIGGAVAANRFGLNRLSAGTWRDAVLGGRVVHADGTITKTGGKVVKNVAGYDLAKLYVGSCGSLVFLGEVNLRLGPRPQCDRLLVRGLEMGRAQEAFLAVHRAGLQPAALLVVRGMSQPAFDSRPEATYLVARFVGRENVVRSQVVACQRLVQGDELDPHTGRAMYAQLQQQLEPLPRGVLMRVSTLPAAVVELVESASRAIEPAPEIIGQFGVGSAHIRCSAAASASAHRWVASLPADVHVCVLHTSDRQFDPPRAAWTPATASLQHAMKYVFDSAGSLRPAPFAPASESRAPA